MKRRRHIKILSAFVLSVCLAAGHAFAVPASQTGQLTGENDVTEMLVNVIVPSNLNFVLDPLEMSTEGEGQIIPHDFFFINKTAAPVNVSLTLDAVLGDGTELVNDPAVLSKDDAGVTDKRLFFAMLGADALTAGDLSFSNTAAHTAEGSYDPMKDTLIPFDSASKKAGISFALDAALESIPEGGYDTLAADDKGVGVFQFYAEINTYASWAKGDVSVKGYYTLTPLRSSTYDRYQEENGFTESGWGTQLKQTGPDGSYITISNPIMANDAARSDSESPFVPATLPPATEPPVTPSPVTTSPPATLDPVSDEEEPEEGQISATWPPGLGGGPNGQ